MRRVIQLLGVVVLVVLATGPAAYAGGMRGGAAVSRTGPHGTTAQAGARGGAYAGPGGRTVAGGVHSVKVTGPEGSTYVHGGVGGVAAGPRGVAAAAQDRSGLRQDYPPRRTGPEHHPTHETPVLRRHTNAMEAESGRDPEKYSNGSLLKRRPSGALIPCIGGNVSRIGEKKASPRPRLRV